MEGQVAVANNDREWPNAWRLSSHPPLAPISFASRSSLATPPPRTSSSVPSSLTLGEVYFSFLSGLGCLQTQLMSYLELTRDLGPFHVSKIRAFKSPEVINAKARESINLICFHQSRIKREREKEGGWKVYHRRVWTFTCQKTVWEPVKMQVLTNTAQYWRLMGNGGLQPFTSNTHTNMLMHTHVHSHIILK